MKTILAFAIVAVVIVGGIALWGTGGTGNGRGADAPGATEDAGFLAEKGREGAAEKSDSGAYQAYGPEKLALAANGKVVLFFRASWCSTCRGLDADIRANLQSIPAGVTILDVTYDSATELKQKYGVTYQHTLVQVDARGNKLAKWTGSPTLASLLSQVK